MNIGVVALMAIFLLFLYAYDRCEREFFGIMKKNNNENYEHLNVPYCKNNYCSNKQYLSDYY